MGCKLIAAKFETIIKGSSLINIFIIAYSAVYIQIYATIKKTYHRYDHTIYTGNPINSRRESITMCAYFMNGIKYSLVRI